MILTFLSPGVLAAGEPECKWIELTSPFDTFKFDGKEVVDLVDSVWEVGLGEELPQPKNLRKRSRNLNYRQIDIRRTRINDDDLEDMDWTMMILKNLEDMVL